METCPRCGGQLQTHQEESIEHFWQTVPGGQAFFGQPKTISVSWAGCLVCGFVEVIDFQPAEATHEPLGFN